MCALRCSSTLEGPARGGGPSMWWKAQHVVEGLASGGRPSKWWKAQQLGLTSSYQEYLELLWHCWWIFLPLFLSITQNITLHI